MTKKIPHEGGPEAAAALCSSPGSSVELRHFTEALGSAQPADPSCYNGADSAPSSPPSRARLPRRRASFPPFSEGSHLPVYSVFISLESVVNRGAHTGRHGVGVGGVRVLVGVQLGPVVEVHRLHGPGAVRVSVHGGRDAHPVHPVVGQVFVLHNEKHAGATQ